jgi:hypothetical protein
MIIQTQFAVPCDDCDGVCETGLNDTEALPTEVWPQTC